MSHRQPPLTKIGYRNEFSCANIIIQTQLFSMRLLIISIGTLIMAAMAWGIAHFWGLSQIHVPFESDFFKPGPAIHSTTLIPSATLKPSDQNHIQNPSPNSNSNPNSNHGQQSAEWVVIPWEQNFFLEKIPGAVLWADVYRGEADLLLVKPWMDRNLPNRQLEKKSNSTRPLLSDLLQQYSQARFVLNITDNVERIHEQVANIIEQTKASGRVIITSPYPVVINSIKDLKPMELYSNSTVDFVKLNFFESIYLLPAMPFKYDLFVGPLLYKKATVVSENMITELHRRHKKVLLGPLSTPEQIQQARKLGADGFFISDPILWQTQTSQ